MYTEKEIRDSTLRKRGFKFVNKSGKRAISAVVATKTETNEIERPEFPWPDELMALMNQIGYSRKAKVENNGNSGRHGRRKKE